MCKLDAQLTCAVCLDRYTDPKTLPCLHSFCKGCIDVLPDKLEGGKHVVECPVCRQPTQLSDRGASAFPTAFHINNLLEIDELLRATPAGEPPQECPAHKRPQVNRETCAICLDRYTDPRTLPCHHSFCEGCIIGLYKFPKGKRHIVVNCPICHQPTRLGDKGVNALPRLGDKLLKKSAHSVPTVDQRPRKQEVRQQCCSSIHHSLYKWRRAFKPTIDTCTHL